MTKQDIFYLDGVASNKGFVHVEYEEDTDYESLKWKNGFDRILLKTVFEDVSSLIMRHLYNIREAGFDDTKKIYEMLDSWSRRQLDVAKLLLILKTGNEEISLKRGKLKCGLPSSILEELTTRVEKEYREESLDRVPMSYEEAEDILNAAVSNPPFDWDSSEVRWLCEYHNLTLEELEEYMWEKRVCEDEIIAFAVEKEVPCEIITTEQIQGNIKRLEGYLKKSVLKGRPHKNEKLYAAMSVFIKYGLKPEAKIFRTAFECFDYVGLIDEALKNDWSRKDKDYSCVQYMKSIYRQCNELKIKFESQSIPF